MRTVTIFIAINPSEMKGQAGKLNNFSTSQDPVLLCNVSTFYFSDPATPFPHH